MPRLIACLLPLLALATAEGDDGHGHEHDEDKPLCACAAAEDDHPFTINCNDRAAILGNTTILSTQCGTPSDANCEGKLKSGNPTCQIAFFMIQAHHDYCDHDALPLEAEHLVHDWEAHCHNCQIERHYDASRYDCPMVDCHDLSVVWASHYVLNQTCVPAEEEHGDEHADRRQLEEGSCCQTRAQIGAFKQIVAYHDLCSIGMPPEVELDLHYYEHACEDHFCNAVGPGYDGTVCPSPPSPPSPPTDDGGIPVGTLIGIVVPIVVVLILLGIFICFMYTREKKGKPIFTSLDASTHA